MKWSAPDGRFLFKTLQRTNLCECILETLKGKVAKFRWCFNMKLKRSRHSTWMHLIFIELAHIRKVAKVARRFEMNLQEPRLMRREYPFDSRRLMWILPGKRVSI